MPRPALLCFATAFTCHALPLHSQPNIALPLLCLGLLCLSIAWRRTAVALHVTALTSYAIALPGIPRVAIPRHCVSLPYFPIASLSKVLPLRLFASLCHSFASPRIALPALCYTLRAKTLPRLRSWSSACASPSKEIQCHCHLCDPMPSQGRSSYSIASAEHRLALPIRCYDSLLPRTSYLSLANAARRLAQPLLRTASHRPAMPSHCCSNLRFAFPLLRLALLFRCFASQSCAFA